VSPTPNGGTARGLLFVTLEGETGTVQAAVMPDMLQQHRQVLVRSPGLILESVLQKRYGVLSGKAEKDRGASFLARHWRGLRLRPCRPRLTGPRRPGMGGCR
jgi:hypothetical protein